MNIAFFGSPKLASDILAHIHNKFPVSLVVTQPDKPVGRKQELMPTPVKQFAEQQDIPFETNLKLVSTLFKQYNINLAIVVAYGELIPKQLLETPRFGFLNVHYSLLPKYRGAAPVQWALLNGDEKTGVSIIQLDEQLDHGPIVATKEVLLNETDTTQSLLDRLTETTKPLLFTILDKIQKTQKLPSLTPQNHDLATSTRQLTKDDGFIEFQTIKKAINNEQLTIEDIPMFQKEIFNKKLHVTRYTLYDVHNFIRAMYPWPIAWTKLPNGKRVKLIKSHIEKRSGDIYGALILDEIQVEGKSRVNDLHLIKKLFS